MKQLIGAALIGQSGGPTSAINASASGVFLQALKHKDIITNIYAAKHGIKGVLDEEFFDIGLEEEEEIHKLLHTPSSAIGSVRYKLKDPNVDDSEYLKLLEIFKKYNIRYFFYNGGNDSMDTCNKVSQFFKKSNYECRVIGVPKTIDNDLAITDHCPGYGSAAKYIATSMMELYLDATVYDIKTITVVEIMGRHAGWLTAAAYLGSVNGIKPDLFYLPEVSFDLEVFYSDVERVLATKNNVVIAVSEGITTKEGKFIPELFSSDLQKDSFGHAQLTGTALTLGQVLKNKFTAKVRTIELSLLQRSASHLASKTDILESKKCGEVAVLSALKGKSDYMVGIQRISSSPYKVKYNLIPLSEVANYEKKIPLEWILKDNTGLTKDYIDYALPLIQGSLNSKLVNSLPDFAKLKKILVDKK